MTGIDSWDTTPATNATADGGAINWSEGQPPSSVNNTARQMLADTRAAFNDLIWFQYSTGNQGAGNIAVPSVYASGTSFTITGADVTLVYTAGRRVRAVGTGTGTIYGTIASSAYSSPTTTITVVWDSGSLSNETLVISLSQIPVTGSPVPGGVGSTFFNASVANPTGTASTAAIIMMGVGGTWAVTPKLGKVRITISGTSFNDTANDGAIIQLRYGTGTAPANGDAITGTQAGRSINVASAFNTQTVGFSIVAAITGLTPGTAYWFDIGLAAVTGGTASATQLSILLTEYS